MNSNVPQPSSSLRPASIAEPAPPPPPSTSIPHADPRLNLRNPNFTFARPLARYCLPLSKFARLPTNASKLLIASCAIPRPLPSTPTALLILKRSVHEEVLSGYWEMPGGKAELGKDQTLLEAVVRECREETGLRVTKIKGEFEGFEWPESAGFGRAGKQYNFVVEVAWEDEEEEEEGRVKLDPREHVEWRWITREELERLTAEEGEGFRMTKDQRKCVLDGIAAVERVRAAQGGGGDVPKPR